MRQTLQKRSGRGAKARQAAGDRSEDLKALAARNGLLRSL